MIQARAFIAGSKKPQTGTAMNALLETLTALGVLATGIAALIEALRPLIRRDKLERRS